MKKLLWLVAIPLSALGDGFGRLSDTSVRDRATICLQIGAQASLTGLQDVLLVAQGVSGSAGVRYTGSDEFNLQTNTPVRVLIEGPSLKQGQHEIPARYLIEGAAGYFDTSGEGAYSGVHQLDIEAQLGTISSQPAGNYQSVVTLTVVPLQGGNAGCGEVTLTFPGDSDSNYAVLAFEDLYPSPGDADYNDFVVRYSIDESYNANGELETIDMEFTPLARGAGYNHALKLDLDGVIERTRTAFTDTGSPFLGDAVVKLTYTNETNDTEIVKYFSPDKDIPIFHNTRATLDGFANVDDSRPYILPSLTTKVEISLLSPELNLLSDDHEIATDKYRIYLDVLSTNSDIDLAVVNPNDGMIDPNGYPFGLLVPDDWAWINEREHIDEAYPFFEEYRQYLAGETDTLSPEAEFWFKGVDTSSGATIDLDALQEFFDSANDSE